MDPRRDSVSDKTQTDPVTCEDEETQMPERRTVGIDAESQQQGDQELEQLLRDDAMARCPLFGRCTRCSCTYYGIRS
jgi:hypothetical protein